MTASRSGYQLNSSEVASAVRDGDLEAGLVALPIDDTFAPSSTAVARASRRPRASSWRWRRRAWSRWPPS
jgi:hypothetical protein